MFRSLLVFIFAIAVSSAAPNRDSRILGGRNAFLGEVPYQASLRYWGSTFHFAGGVLINTRYVVTGAYNLRLRAANSINIVLGIVSLDTGVVNRQSDYIVIHDQFAIEGNIIKNDIAMVRAAYAITFSTTVSPIPLSSSFVRDGMNGQISGWGATETDKGPDSNNLKIANVVTGPCKDTEFMTFTPQHICAGSPSTTPVGICTTDIGGPLTLYGQLIGIGVHHYYYGCGMYFDGFSRISSYYVWINQYY
ncbi:chymotrypsin-1-like [Chironomus tepperi]|uniref:chymotrypsin-1-like n=1 Tax=Chironomus tepperi TaxID=113505 RepID=UPI00391FBE91